MGLCAVLPELVFALVETLAEASLLSQAKAGAHKQLQHSSLGSA